MKKWTNPCSKDGLRLDFGHLGGTTSTGDPDSWFPELWSWLVTVFGVKSFFDVGCGVGHTMQFFDSLGVDVCGIDCEPVLKHHVMNTRCVESHDLTEGPYLTHPAHLVWCCEVAEHVDERFVQNVIETVVKNCVRVLAFCAAPTGAGGYHHVNCQDPPYWVEKITSAGLVYSEKLTAFGRSLCCVSCERSEQNYFLRSGLVFTTCNGA